jgi:ceramide glucosyltransferase
MTKPVSMVFPKDSLKEYFSHELRWSIGLKSVRPWGYCGLVFTHGLPWAVIGTAVALSIGSISVAAFYLVAYLILRVGLAWLTGVWGLGDRRLAKILWLVPVRDAISFVVWVSGFFSDKISWRGLDYRVQKGRLFPVSATSQSLPPRQESVSPAAS